VLLFSRNDIKFRGLFYILCVLRYLITNGGNKMTKLTNIIMGIVAAGMIGAMSGCVKRIDSDEPVTTYEHIERPSECTKLVDSGITSYGKFSRSSVPYISCEADDGTHSIYELHRSGGLHWVETLRIN